MNSRIWRGSGSNYRLWSQFWCLERDFVINRNGVKAPVSTLVGKNILYFGNHHRCPSSRAFLPRLIKAYDKIKEDDDNFEIILVTVDKDQNSFDETLSEMSWLALPFGDQGCESLSCKTFTILTIPSLVAIGPTGKTLTRQGVDFLIACESDAYPFTEEHLKDMEAKFEEMANTWPEKVTRKGRLEMVMVMKKQQSKDGCVMEISDMRLEYFIRVIVVMFMI